MLETIYGYFELLKKDENGDNTGIFLSMIENNADVLKQLTEELFCYSVVVSVDDSKVETVIINHVLEESFVAYYGAFKECKITPYINITRWLRN